MEKVDQNLDRVIEKITAHMLTLDPGSKDFGMLAGRLDALLRQREARFKSEMQAVENENRLEFENKKLEEEKRNNESRLEFENKKLEEEKRNNESRLEFEEKKLKVDQKTARSRNRMDIFKSLSGIAEVVIGAGISAYLVLTSQNMEYSEHLNVQPKVWNLIPKIKTKH